MPTFRPTPTRRDLLRASANGFGLLALADLLRAADAPAPPLAPKPPHFAPRARRVIFLFMHGGPSQVDTFDPKPRLKRHHGQPYPGLKPRVQFASTGNLLQSPWAFRPGGESGLQVSDLFPEVRKRADDLCVIRSVHADNSAHGGALLQLHTGSDTFVRPSAGSWVTYGLGTENQNLPGFVTLNPTLSHGGVQNFSSAFLPAAFAGTPVGYSGIPAKESAVRDISPSDAPARQRLQLDLLEAMNRDHLAAAGPDAALEGRIEAFELAFRMQAEAPRVMDLGREPAKVRDAYGIGDGLPTDNFGRQCLLARRLAEAGVRFVQCTHSYKWDQHDNLCRDHEKNAREVDRPIAALLADLKQRDLLRDTLVWWGGEFGRTPTAQGGDGRDHNPHGFSMWLAGGGVKGGHVHGATDDFGYYAVEDRVHMHDVHATILHLLGLDHEKLTYRHAGRDFRLTDVKGTVVREIFA
ncbi:MAG: DUF1501 domain-containing protein [Isosphaera sp.]|nr:DUF1501 domain-containing protein [Isosphaera sp.]